KLRSRVMMRRADFAAGAGAVALIQSKHDGREHRYRCGMVAETGRRPRGLGAGVVHQTHQPGSRPVCCRIITRLLSFRPDFSVTCHLSVNELRIDSSQLLETQPEL